MQHSPHSLRLYSLAIIHSVSEEGGLSDRIVWKIIGVEVLPIESLFVHHLGKVPQHLLLSPWVVLKHPVNGKDQVLPSCTRPSDPKRCLEETLISTLEELHHGWQYTCVTAVHFMVLHVHIYADNHEYNNIIRVYSSLSLSLCLHVYLSHDHHHKIL